MVSTLQSVQALLVDEGVCGLVSTMVQNVAHDEQGMRLFRIMDALVWSVVPVVICNTVITSSYFFIPIFYAKGRFGCLLCSFEKMYYP
jgi:hypothetical protein